MVHLNQLLSMMLTDPTAISPVVAKVAPISRVHNPLEAAPMLTRTAPMTAHQKTVT